MTKYVKYICNENYKILLRKINKDLNKKGDTYSVHGLN